jgi:hypothetical protein
MSLLLKALIHPIFSRGIVALLDLVEVKTPPIIVEVKVRRSTDTAPFHQIFHHFSLSKCQRNDAI